MLMKMKAGSDSGQALELAGRVRDLVETALILSVAAMMWFGWGQARPPHGWSVPLGIGQVAGIAAVIAASVLSWRVRSVAPSMNEPKIRSTYWRVVAIELAACGLGVATLAIVHQSAYIPAWILLVVGVHFLPLARLFRISDMYRAGLAVSAVAIVAAATGAATGVRPSAVAGAGGGLVCLVCAVSCMRRIRHECDATSAGRAHHGRS
jgi:hypothetical protein